MSSSRIFIVKPFKSHMSIQNKDQSLQKDGRESHQILKPVANKIEFPGEDLFIKKREDVTQKLMLKRNKGYFNPPKDLDKILRKKDPKQEPLIKVIKPGFLNKKISKMHNPSKLDTFKDAVSPSKMKQKAQTGTYNFSEFRMTGVSSMADSTITTIQSPKDTVEILNDPNYELNEILHRVGLGGIKEFKAGSLYHKKTSNQSRAMKSSLTCRNDKNLRTNPIFARNQDTKKLKYIFRKIIMQKREAKLKKETEVLPTEENTANESFKAAVLQRMNQKSKNQVNRNYRRNLFTPDSALNTLPSMQIAMVVPNENAVDGTKRYNNQARIRSQLERTRMRSTTGTKFAKSPQYIKKTAKLNISLSSQFDHNRDSPILQNQELNKYAHANIVEKHTVYANRVRSNGSNRNHNNIGHNREGSQYSMNVTSINAVITPTQPKDNISKAAKTAKTRFFSPVISTDPFENRNCFVMSQSPKRVDLKSYQRVKAPKQKFVKFQPQPSNRRVDLNESTFSTVAKEEYDKDKQMSEMFPVQKMNLTSGMNSPLQNEMARDHHEEHYDKFFDNSQDLEHHRRNMEQYMVNVPEEIMIKGLGWATSEMN